MKTRLFDCDFSLRYKLANFNSSKVETFFTVKNFWKEFFSQLAQNRWRNNVPSQTSTQAKGLLSKFQAEVAVQEARAKQTRC